MADPASYARSRKNFLRLRYEEDPTILIDELVQLAEQAAGVGITRYPFPLPA